MSRIEFFHAPHTRSSGVLALMEELGADYDLKLMSIKAGDQSRDDFLAINPMGKVPTIRQGDAVVTEQVAVYLFLADHFADASLAPAIGDPDRGPYLRWMAFYGCSIEPAVIDKAMKREPAARATSPYADYDTVMAVVNQQLAKGPWLLGERFSAVDVLWGAALSWLTGFGLVEKTPAVVAYVERYQARPAVQRAAAKDAEWNAAQEAAAGNA